MHDSERLPETEEGEVPVFSDEIPTFPANSSEQVQESDPLPARIDRYRIERILGKGGFGRVYLAYDEELKRKVALKVPRADRVTLPTEMDSYRVEAQILARLDHVAIVPVHDVGQTDDGLCYVVSKFIEGTDLQQKLHNERISHHESANLVATIAEALHYAHNQGLVHRDIKPANILIDLAGKPYVADFGLALKEEDLGTGPSWAGTPCYMSPEQARGEGHLVDGRSDIFSLGVVFYELLTGKRPFRADSQQELLQQVSTVDVRPPRQRDDGIPKELERICLKALSKKASDRYTIARDLADDLWHFLAESPTPDSQTRPTPSAGASTITDTPVAVGVASDTSTSMASAASRSQLIRIIPKGLRSFDAKDADFFLELLPGPRDRSGLPDSIRFWKDRVEETDADETFRVGLIYGPSGCGKSSMLKAGLLPRLSKDVVAVYVEATPDETESRLLQGLRKRCPALPTNLNLKETLAALRRGQGTSHNQKILIVLDQFEQWLHAKLEDVDTELVAALRQCDGGKVQAIVMVRDDFWMAATRFMRELEVRLLEGQNSNAVDLFPLRHARRVLIAFGRAFGELPQSSKDQSQDQTDFIDQAVNGLAHDGKVISVRLALFAEMMKGKPWTPAALREVGGTTGVGVTFLEETFSASTAPPEYRYHQRAARAVLKALLPDSGTDIKGHMRSSDELLKASGYARRPSEFQNLITILDGEIRLVTPTDPSGEQFEEGEALPDGDSRETYFQLTHDYLVPSLRQWLTRKQRETRKGRAELRLAERVSLWSVKLENRHLPSWWEYLSIACLTSKKTWTSPQQKMMRKAGRLHGFRAVMALAVLTLVVFGGVRLRQSIHEGRRVVELESKKKERAARVEELVKSLQNADIGKVASIVEQLESFQSLSRPLLRKHLDTAADHSSQKLNLSLGLLAADKEQVPYLFSQLLQAEAESFPVIRDFLAAEKEQLVPQLWQILENPDGDAADQQLHAAAALATYDPENPQWQTVLDNAAWELATVPVSFLNEWKEAFRPIAIRLMGPLTEIYRDENRDGMARSLAASLLADYASQDVNKLASLVSIANEKQFAVLFPVLAKRDADAKRELRSIIEQEIHPTWNDSPIDSAWESAPAIIEGRFDAADGIFDPRFAFCQTMPFQQCVETIELLRSCGYRPVRFRPYSLGDRVQVAALWTRDSQPWRIEHGLTAQQLQAKDQELRSEGLVPIDVAGYVGTGEDDHLVDRYAAIWGESKDAEIEVRMYAGVPESTEKILYVDPWSVEEFHRRTLSAFIGQDGIEYRSAIWFKQNDQEEATSRLFVGSESHFTGEIFPGLFLTDVNVTRAAKRQDSQQRYAAQLAALESLLAQQEDDIEIRKAIAVVRFQLRQDDLALEDFNWLIEQAPEESRFYQFRSVVHARAQRAEEARQDQELFEERYKEVTQHNYLDAIISAHLGDEAAGMLRLEEAISQDPDNSLLLYNSACAYSICSDILAPRDMATSEVYVERAAALLQESVAKGYDGLETIRRDSDLDALRETPEFLALMNPDNSDRRYLAVWNVSTEFVSTELHGLAPDEQRRRCHALIAEGYRPTSISIGVCTDGASLVSVSVWHRPRVPDVQKELLAKRQSNASVALLRMVDDATVWPLLKHSPDPRVRNYVIHRLAPLNSNPQRIIARLEVEQDLSTRRALIFALGEFNVQQLPPSLREQLSVKLLKLYSNDPDGGIHAATEWVLRQWGENEQLDEADQQLATSKPEGQRQWYVNKQGQTLVMIPGPIEFLMGTPVNTVGREGGPGGQMETLHRQRIGRSFAMMTHEVTVEQYLKFLPDFAYSKYYARENNAPMTRITWYAAAEYCNWLSQQEGIPEDQWCYLPNDDGEYTVGMKPAPDYLQRTGYRLPTGAEWEYACAAGAVTSRFFGESDELLVDYVWCKKNSEDRWMVPVASLKPNDFGLFDMQGNAWEWCHEVSHFFKISMTGGWSEDLPDDSTAHNGQLRVLRGGSFLSQPEDLRTSRRYRYQPSFRNYSVGMRAARTYPATSE